MKNVIKIIICTISFLMIDCKKNENVEGLSQNNKSTEPNYYKVFNSDLADSLTFQIRKEVWLSGVNFGSEDNLPKALRFKVKKKLLDDPKFVYIISEGKNKEANMLKWKVFEDYNNATKIFIRQGSTYFRGSKNDLVCIVKMDISDSTWESLNYKNSNRKWVLYSKQYIKSENGVEKICTDTINKQINDDADDVKLKNNEIDFRGAFVFATNTYWICVPVPSH